MELSKVEQLRQYLQAQMPGLAVRPNPDFDTRNWEFLFEKAGRIAYALVLTQQVLADNSVGEIITELEAQDWKGALDILQSRPLVLTSRGFQLAA
ncbi:MAG: hypothetical protein ACRD5W_06905 [Candidatus Acidiferrales bacterium]